MRPLWALVPLYAGGFPETGWRDRYLDGIKAGIDAHDEEYWGDFQDHDQKFVELAPLAFAILCDRDMWFDRLGAEDRKRLCRWLGQVNGFSYARCNWLFFRVFVNLALKRVGSSSSQERLDEDLLALDGWYQGEGWYQDGVSGRHDYYVSFAMHFYGLVLSVVASKELGPRASVYRMRAEQFASKFLAWFSSRGEALCYGRSLTYRFAQSAFWAAYLWAGCKGIDPSVIKGVINRNLRYFLDHPIFLDGGVLSVGYLYPNLNMAERYNGPGSPYWALKTFLLLALMDDHPFWRAEEAPQEKVRGTYCWPKAEMLLLHDGADAFAFVPGNSGMRDLGRFSAKYGKFCYSSLFPFSVPISNGSLEDVAADSMLVFLDDGMLRFRQKSEAFELSSQKITSRWNPLRGVQVQSTLFPFFGGHTRIHRIATDRPIACFDGGFAVALPAETKVEGLQAIADQGWRGCSIEGQGPGATPLLVRSTPNTNLGSPNVVIPTIGFHLEAGITEIRTIVRYWRGEGECHDA